MKEEKFWLWVAAMLPEPLVYWAALRLMAYATTGEYGRQEVPALLMMTALDRWEKMMYPADQTPTVDLEEALRPGDPRCDYRGP